MADSKTVIAVIPPEVRARAVRMVCRKARCGSMGRIGQRSCSVAAKIGCTATRPCADGSCRREERDARGCVPGPTSQEGERIRALEREVRELRQANEILRKASARILPRRSSTAGPSHDRVHRRAIASRLRGRADLPGPADRPVDLPCPCGAVKADPGTALRLGRSRDDELKPADPSASGKRTSEVYGVRKVWHQLNRRGADAVATRCTVARLMRRDGAWQGRHPGQAGPGPRSSNRRCGRARRTGSIGSSNRHASECRLWLSLTSPMSPPGRGFVYVAFVIDAFARQHCRLAGVRRRHAGRLRAGCPGTGPAMTGDRLDGRAD